MYSGLLGVSLSIFLHLLCIIHVHTGSLRKGKTKRTTKKNAWNKVENDSFYAGAYYFPNVWQSPINGYIRHRIHGESEKNPREESVFISSLLFLRLIA